MPKFRTPLTLRVTLDCKHKVTWGFVSWTCSRCHCWLNNSSFCRVQVSLQVVNLQQQADDLTGSPKCHEKSGEIDFPLGSRVACVVSGSSEVFLESRVGTRREICPWVVAVRVVGARGIPCSWRWKRRWCTPPSAPEMFESWWSFVTNPQQPVLNSDD